MDPGRNPYSPGAGLRPPELAGREAELAEMQVLMERTTNGLVGRSVVLTGLRGVGKTVLLGEMASAASARGWVVARVEAEGGTAGRSFPEQVAASLSRSVGEVTRAWRLGTRLRQGLATLKAFTLTVDPSGLLSVGLEIDAHPSRAASGILDGDLTDVALDLASAAVDRGVGVALFVDELQELAAPDLAALCGACHAAGQAGAPFYVVGAGLPSLPRLLGDARSYAERLFAYHAIDALAPEAARKAIVLPSESAGVPWQRAAADLLVDRSGGYPYFVQELAKRTWDAASGDTVTLDAAHAGVRLGTISLDRGFFTSRWERASWKERELLAAMAVDGDRVRFGSVAERLGRSPRSLSPARASLIRKGLVYASDHGMLSFTVPGMADFIRRQPRE